ncbi:MAG: hypothetical protein JNL63_06265 [Bacteroidia bacterium]|nr:hypothetical protein [Bacteroidia bacterium]
MMQRSSISASLTQKFFNDYKSVMKQYETEEQIELTKYLLNTFSIYHEGQETYPAKIKLLKEKLESIQKKYGKKFKAYKNGQLHKYFHFDTVLAEKEIYTVEQYNKLEEQSLTEKEKEIFIQYCYRGLQQHLDELYLESEPESKVQLEGATGKTKGKGIKRDANDKITCLSQYQTVLLMYYLQQEKVFLRGEYLSDLDAGRAFEILTGYSQHTLRQNLSKYHLYQTTVNLKEIDNLLTRLKIAIGKDLKAS